MSIPLIGDKTGSEAIVTPAAMVAHRRAGGRLLDIGTPSAAIVCLERGLPRRMRRQVPVRHVGRLMGELHVVRRSAGGLVVLSDFGLGAPIVAAQVEELIALGVRRVVSVALSGGLQPDLAPGAVVLAEAALADDGTSRHYLPSVLAADAVVRADPELADRLGAALDGAGIVHRRGCSWSTDAPYRETRDEAIRYGADGVLTVDMELAALLTVARVRGVAAAGMLVVGDSLAGGVWTPPAALDAMQRSLDAVYLAAVEVLGGR